MAKHKRKQRWRMERCTTASFESRYHGWPCAASTISSLSLATVNTTCAAMSALRWIRSHGQRVSLLRPISTTADHELRSTSHDFPTGPHFATHLLHSNGSFLQRFSFPVSSRHDYRDTTDHGHPQLPIHGRYFPLRRHVCPWRILSCCFVYLSHVNDTLRSNLPTSFLRPGLLDSNRFCARGGLWSIFKTSNWELKSTLTLVSSIVC